MVSEQVLAGARTIRTAASHLAELQQAAARLLGASSVSQRGYFTPTEDEETRHLLVSYWQTRNALMELVWTLRNDLAEAGEQRDQSFIVGYAGALALVDAARFLRENLHDQPVVRAKLNEPAPEFGIPAGVYQRVQSSLTSPAHAWHMYHAARYYEQHQQELCSLAASTPLAELLQIIERLQNRVSVSASQYASSRVRVRGRQIAEAVKRDLLWRAMYGMQKAVSSLAADKYLKLRHRPALPREIREQLRLLLAPGDVMIVRKEHAVTNYFLPGYWPHAAVCLGDARQLGECGLADHLNMQPRWKRLLECDADEPGRVLEAKKDGVWIRSFASPFASDAMAVLRPRLSKEQITEALGRGLFHEGKPYDFDFDFTRSDRLVCTEVVYRSYEGVGGMSFSLTRRAGRLTLAAEDLMRLALRDEQFDTQAVYSPAHAPKLLLGDAAAGVLRETVASESVAAEPTTATHEEH